MLRTKEQRKQLCAKCPFAKTADLIGDSVVLLIVRELLAGPKRFSDLEEALSGISTRTLVEKLKMLEEHDVMEKKERKGKVLRAEYVLTKKGTGLKPLSTAMIAYGKKYLS